LACFGRYGKSLVLGVDVNGPEQALKFAAQKPPAANLAGTTPLI